MTSVADDLTESAHNPEQSSALQNIINIVQTDNEGETHEDIVNPLNLSSPSDGTSSDTRLLSTMTDPSDDSSSKGGIDTLLSISGDQYIKNTNVYYSCLTVKEDNILHFHHEDILNCICKGSLLKLSDSDIIDLQNQSIDSEQISSTNDGGQIDQRDLDWPSKKKKKPSNRPRSYLSTQQIAAQ